MKTLIIYSTYYKSTEKCAIKINESIQDSRIINIEKEQPDSIGDYDKVIIGTPIHAWKIHRVLKSYLSKISGELENKKIYFFYCGLDFDCIEKAVLQLPENIQNKIRYSSCFGGRILKSELSGFENQIIGIVEKKMNVDYSDYNSIDDDKINSFIDFVKKD
jgi:menaquinone-dependent protoporphyrinogen IX oxidase